MKQKTYLGGVVLVTRAVGTEDINLSDSRLVKTGFSTATESNSRPIKVELTENGIKKETGYNISVADSIISIRVKTPPKTAYKYNEELDLTGSLLEVTKGSGKTDIPITTAMLSAYDKTRLGNQNLTVTYGGKTAPDPIVVNVKDYVTGIKVTPSTIERTVGEELSSVITNNNIQYIVTYAKVGDRLAVPLTTGMVTTNYDKTSTTNQTLTITYTDNDNDSFTKGQTFPATLNANFKNTAKSIAITPPSKTVYKHGESLDLTGGTIVITNQDNTTTNVTMTTAMIKENGATVNMSPASYDSTNKVTKTLKIEYTKDGVPGTVDYPITIVNDVQSIVVHDPLKTPYNVNESFDNTIGSILVTRAVGTPEAININDSRIDVQGFSSAAENANLPLTIKFTENTFYKTTTTNVEIKDSIISIKIKTPPKTAYKYNEELDVTGGVLEVTKGSGVTTIPMTAAMLLGYDKTVLGNQQLTVSHGGVEAEDKFTVNVKDYVTGIKVNPATITREVGDTLADLITNNSIKYTVTYAKAGDKSPVTLLESMVSGFNASDTTSKALTVTYEDNDNDSFTKGQTFPATLNANFQNTAKSIKITPPRKTIYKHGESLDLTGGVIEITNQDNTKDYVTMTTAMITEDGSAANMSPASYDSTNKVTKTLKIEYTKDGVPGTANYPIEIVNDVQSIVVHDPLKTPYNVNESFDNTTGSILVTRAVGTPEAININDSRIDVQGFSSAAENANLPLTIKFTENTFYKTTTTNVEIKDSVISIKVLTPPKTAYKYNEELDLTGALLEVTKGSGKTDIAITSDMLSTYDKTRLGDQSLTVTYGGKTATDPIVVNVKDYVTGIKVSPSTVERVVGEELASLIQANQIKYIVTYAKAGDKSPVDLQVTMVTTTYDKTSKADQPLTITYTDNDDNSFTKGQPFTATLNANFKNTAKTIAIKPPTKTVYKHGEGLSLDGGEIKITNQDGTTSYVTMEPGMIKENGGLVNMSPATYDSTNKVQKTLTIEYTKDGVLGTVDYPITIVNYVTKIEMQDNPKLSYNVNEAEDLTGGSILVTRKVGTPEVIDLDDSRVSVTGFNSVVETTSPLPITVTFTENGFSCDPTGYDITVTDSVTGIVIKTPPRRDQKYNEEIDLTGAMLTVTSGSGPRDIAITKDMLSTYDNQTLGDKQLTVTYSGKTAPTQITVTVKDYVTGIKINPDTVTGEYNKELADLITDNSITYTVTYAKAGDTSPSQPLTTSMVSGYSKTSKQTQNLTVTYEDNDNDSFTKGQTFPATLTVEANNPVTGITIKAPDKVIYKHGESLDLTGGTITLTHVDGTTSNVTMLDSMITEGGNAVNMSPSSYNSTNKVQKTLTINYTKDRRNRNSTISNNNSK